VERGLPSGFNSFATSTKRETLETVPTDHESRHPTEVGCLMRSRYRIRCYSSLEQFIVRLLNLSIERIGL
jgi:hypothetical protein